MKQMKVWVLALICLAMLCSTASAAMLFIDPGETELGMGESVELAVMVEDVQHLGSYDIGVTWDPVLVSLSEVRAAPQITNLTNKDQNGEVHIAGLSNTLEGISETADLCYLTFTAINDNGATSPIAITVNEYGFLNSMTGEEIQVDTINGNITVLTSSVVDARIALASRQVPADKETTIRASVANQRSSETAPLDINVTIWNGDTIVNTTVYTDEVIQPGATFSREILWTPGAEGTFVVKIEVTSDDPVRGSPTGQISVTAIDYLLSYRGTVNGPNRVQMNNWFYEYIIVSANKAGPVDVHIEVPDSFEISGGADQTRYFYDSNWNYLYILLRANKPGQYTADQFTYNISAHGKSDSVNGKDITIYVPSIEVTSVNTTSIAGASETMKFNTLHTNNTHENETVLIAQSGAQGRTLSGLEYLIGYPYGCVEQTTCKMLASMNVKNYYLGRPVEDRPANFDTIRDRANASVSSGVDRLVYGGTRGQNRDGGWSLWGGDPSESSSSSYAGYTFARINETDEDLNHLLVDHVSYNDTVESGNVNFDLLIQWFNENHDTSEGTWSWSAPVCHSWTPESNTAFVMLIHDMINKTADVKQPYRGYMEENMQNATRYIIDNQESGGAFSGGDDAAMATALGLWGLEVFGLPSDTIEGGNITEADITEAKANAKAYLLGSQETDGSWSAGNVYGWYQKGRTSETTAYAILALNATGVENDDPHIANGVGWLVDTYENSGSWGYTWASQAAIDALTVCQGTKISTGTLDVFIDDVKVCTFDMSSTNPRETYTLDADQMAAMMAVEGQEKRDIFDDGFSTVKWHKVEGVLTAGDGPIVLSVENSQWAPLNEIDSDISDSHTIQMDGFEDDVFIPQFSTNIDALVEGESGMSGYSITFDSDPYPMVVGTEAEMTIVATSTKGDVFSPMIEVPIADFTFDNSSEDAIKEGDNSISYEVLNSTANIGQKSIFIQPESWVQDVAHTYTFKIVPENYGILNTSLRIIQLYDDTKVAVDNYNFDVTGTGNVTIHVQDENYAPVDADSITVGVEIPVTGASTGEFTGLLEDTYDFSVNKTGYPDVHGTVAVSYGETAVYNVTMPTTMTEPVLILSEGGSGSIAGVAQIPALLSASYVENSTYNISVMGDGGELGVALEFPMRYLFNGDPVVTLNGVELGSAKYELIQGTFEFNNKTRYYSTSNATLIVYNATSGTNYIGLEFAGDAWGDTDGRKSGDRFISINDAMYAAQISADIRHTLITYDYPDVNGDGKITINDAMYIAQRSAGLRDAFYKWTG